MSSSNVLVLSGHLENFVSAAPNNIQFPFVSIFGHQNPISLPHFRHPNMSVHLQDHMHLASAFLSKHCRHRIQGTFSLKHVTIHGRRFMRVISHSGKIQWKMGCTSLVNVERRWSKTVARQVVKLNLGEQKVDIRLVVTKDVVCTQALKDQLVAVLRQAIASRAVGHCLVHLDLETLCQLFSNAWDSNSLSRSETISRGHPLSRITSRKNTWTGSSAVMSLRQGIFALCIPSIPGVLGAV